MSKDKKIGPEVMLCYIQTNNQPSSTHEDNLQRSWWLHGCGTVSSGGQHEQVKILQISLLTFFQMFLFRLPGWDKQSYGYHGDDGHSFCSSGTGQAYGPTFTTGDVIGCGLNLIDGSCFYTKNGIHLGAAFSGKEVNTYIALNVSKLSCPKILI